MTHFSRRATSFTCSNCSDLTSLVINLSYRCVGVSINNIYSNTYPLQVKLITRDVRSLQFEQVNLIALLEKCVMYFISPNKYPEALQEMPLAVLFRR